jgi:hypothetical protein
MRALADEELATERRNTPKPVREVRSLIGKTKRKLGLGTSGTVQVSYR